MCLVSVQSLPSCIPNISGFLHANKCLPPYLMSISLIKWEQQACLDLPALLALDWIMQNLLCVQNKSGQFLNALIAFLQSLRQEKSLTITKTFAPNMQVESSATPLLTIDEVEKVQRQKIEETELLNRCSGCSKRQPKRHFQRCFSCTCVGTLRVISFNNSLFFKTLTSMKEPTNYVCRKAVTRHLLDKYVLLMR